MALPFHPSPFVEVAAVEAWDAWFRWREHAQLRDVSIEDTWGRVSTSLASVEVARESATWQRRFMEALASWRVLPDARLLADAGTGRTGWGGGVLHAAVNVACFVPHGRSPGVAFSLAAIEECAALAVRMLDNAALLANIAVPQLRVGVVGIADALSLLGVHYDSDAGRACAASMAGALATGSLQGSIALATTRGAARPSLHGAPARRTLSRAPRALRRDAARRGLRHARLTAITSQRRLALLANDVADAADPLRGAHHAHVIDGPEGRRTLRSSGYALHFQPLCPNDGDEPPDTLASLPWTAQLDMRAALQPWIDEPIDYPLLATRDPDSREHHDAQGRAARHGLGEPAWRNPDALLPL